MQTRESWLSALWNLPLLRWFEPMFETTPEWEAEAEAPEPAEVCAVVPLEPIEDADALILEESVTSIDVTNMTSGAARALERFESNVAAAGGTMVLKSAYRPATYQKHLQDVWYKWMRELRDNADPGCQSLRAQVADEFTRHRLIETQHPVAISDHTRGLAFDATVDLPIHARLGRQPVTVDRLARLAGLLRPAIVADPVHFKYVGVTLRSGRRIRTA